MTELWRSALAEINSGTKHNAKVIIEPMPAVNADRAMIHQVLINLLANAIKYSSKAGLPVVNISSYEKDEDVVFAVKDNGVGFDNQYIDKLFGVFQRLHSNEEFEGTGVGLALVKRIINKHGGRVWAWGEVNMGATFEFSLPKFVNSGRAN